VHGFEVDDAARRVIQEAGYGDYFIHRTGHSIHVSDHGPGANMDNLETHDTRTLMPMTGFSIEPGIYLPGDFGVRSEINVALTPEGAEVTGGEPQRELIRVLA
jgi:Xaa-Pro aminopeptidase